MPRSISSSSGFSTEVNANRQDAFAALTGGAERPPSNLMNHRSSRPVSSRHRASSQSSTRYPRADPSYIDDLPSLGPDDSISIVAARRMQAESAGPSRRSSTRESSRASSHYSTSQAPVRRPSVSSSRSSQYPANLREHMRNYKPSLESDYKTPDTSPPHRRSSSSYSRPESYAGSSSHSHTRDRSSSRSHHSQAPSSYSTGSRLSRSNSASGHSRTGSSSTTSHSRSRACPPTSYRGIPEPTSHHHQTPHSSCHGHSCTPTRTPSQLSRSSSRASTNSNTNSRRSSTHSTTSTLRPLSHPHHNTPLPLPLSRSLSSSSHEPLLLASLTDQDLETLASSYLGSADYSVLPDELGEYHSYLNYDDEDENENEVGPAESGGRRLSGPLVPRRRKKKVVEPPPRWMMKALKFCSGAW